MISVPKPEYRNTVYGIMKKTATEIQRVWLVITYRNNMLHQRP